MGQVTSGKEKNCSTTDLLKIELENIKKFLSWNGYYKNVAAKLIKKFTSGNNRSKSPTDPNVPKVFIRLPYTGKQGDSVVNKTLKRLQKLINHPVKFIVIYNTRKAATFVSYKDHIPQPVRSFVVYEFKCPGCSSNYIGKTERCLFSRLEEHANSNTNSEIYSHLQNCECFHDLYNIVNILDQPTRAQLSAHLLLRCTKVIDTSKNWSELLLKEALAIKQNSPNLNHGIKASRELFIFK